jgi:hypothetical protein
MNWTPQQYDKYINKALTIAKYDITIEEIREQEGQIEGRKPKEYSPYYLKYPWKTEEEVQEFREFLIKETIKHNPSYSKDKAEQEVDFLEALISLSEINIIREKAKIVNDHLREESL